MSDTPTPAPQRSGIGQGVEALLGLVSVALIGYAWSLEANSEVRRLIGFYDWGFCIYFFALFVRRFRDAEDKRRYMLPWGIFDLLSAVPAVESLRFARIFRVIRVYRLLIAAASLRRMFRDNPREATYSIAGGTIACALVVLTILVLAFESQHPKATITTAGDALWWSVVTMSTVGYGDLYPVTTGGRVCAVMLMFVGIGVFGVIAGIFADFMMRMGRQPRES
ncbi:MAG: ion transporter [Planctomycetes bacterium]|nr:ion transporter [Planctomycetota bacterium]